MMASKVSAYLSVLKNGLDALTHDLNRPPHMSVILTMVCYVMPFHGQKACIHQINTGYGIMMGNNKN